MKLTYRGNSYEAQIPTKPSFDYTDQPQFKLIYRGNLFFYTPRPVMVSEEVETDGPTETLIYRGNTYERKLQSSALSKVVCDQLALAV